MIRVTIDDNYPRRPDGRRVKRGRLFDWLRREVLRGALHPRGVVGPDGTVSVPPSLFSRAGRAFGKV